jgi:hypothetical protein
MLQALINFLNSLFSKKEQIVCPRCLKRMGVNPKQPRETRCPECGFAVPQTYVAEYSKSLPGFIQLVGWTQAGKTMYLDNLRLILYDMDQAWQGYFTRPISQLDLSHKEVLLRERAAGKVPGSTPKSDRDSNSVYIMQLNNMQRWQTRFLTMMDHAGEMFSSFDMPVEDIPFLQHTPTAILLFSLDELLARNAAKTVDDLVNIYVTALETKAGVNFKREHRRLIIVFNKADKVADLPAELQEYVFTDDLYSSLRERTPPPMDSQALAEYIERMGRVSDSIAAWVKRAMPGGSGMLAFLQNRGIDARFCLISATGQELGPQSSAADLRPCRVVDPFFWALEFQSKQGTAVN